MICCSTLFDLKGLHISVSKKSAPRRTLSDNAGIRPNHPQMGLCFLGKPHKEEHFSFCRQTHIKFCQFSIGNRNILGKISIFLWISFGRFEYIHIYNVFCFWKLSSYLLSLKISGTFFVIYKNKLLSLAHRQKGEADTIQAFENISNTLLF